MYVYATVPLCLSLCIYICIELSTSIHKFYSLIKAECNEPINKRNRRVFNPNWPRNHFYFSFLPVGLFDILFIYIFVLSMYHKYALSIYITKTDTMPCVKRQAQIAVNMPSRNQQKICLGLWHKARQLCGTFDIININE